MTAPVKDFDLNRLFTDKIYSGSVLMNKWNSQSPHFQDSGVFELVKLDS